MSEKIRVTEYFEKGFRAVEVQDNLSPEAIGAIAQMRAVMWGAEANEVFPETIIFESEMPPIYNHPDFEFNPETGVVVKGSSITQLKPAQSIILMELSRRPNRLVTTEQLATKLWGDKFLGIGLDDQSIKVHISHLRKKLTGGSKKKKRKKPGVDQSIIKTVKNSGVGKGYVLVDSSKDGYSSRKKIK